MSRGRGGRGWGWVWGGVVAGWGVRAGAQGYTRAAWGGRHQQTIAAPIAPIRPPPTPPPRSFGSTRNAFLDSAIADLVAAGGVVVVAAGNERDNACLESPAGAPAAFAVAASTKHDDFAKDFSNFGSW